ncbi:crossover junction endonuclease MUS81 [Anopheles aquasalis]|uniref:crossover junction endonuclease MUS81 n=1 Tax=Anopheles aquasalis TaxID=42839 RepID=UPI00215A9C0E|nr:crossover junction endonuclease MUS81 [Anopheles aquasalis]
MPPIKYEIKIVKHVPSDTPGSSIGKEYRRIKAHAKRPNPLFEAWLEEMIGRAEEKNSLGKIALQKALTSLRRYPLPLASGRDCIVLADFGKTICENLERRLKSYLAGGGRVETDHRSSIEAILNDETGEHYQELTNAFYTESKDDAADNADDVAVIDDAMMPNDSIFDHIPITLEDDLVRVTNPRPILLVDTCETIGKSKSSLDKTLQELAQYAVEHDVRRLSVGDFAWIVKDDGGREFLLPYVIERKRLDDLASSIKDGRFHEQKFRLKQCGLLNVIYLIEHLGNNRQVGVPEGSLTQAALNTYVQDFTVKYTENHHHTVMYLSVMTNLLSSKLKNKVFRNITNRSAGGEPNSRTAPFNISDQTVPLLSFEYFYKQSSKTRDCSVRDVFIKQLLQIKLLTIEKVNAIVERYPTPQCLRRAYDRCPSETERQRMLNLPYGPTKRTIGDKLSTIIYQLFASDRYAP